MENQDWKEAYIDDSLDSGYDKIFHNGKGKMSDIYYNYRDYTPKSLYKFQGIVGINEEEKEYVYENIRDAKISLSKIESFNDPYDTMLSTGFSDLEGSEKNRTGEEYYKNQINKFRNLMFVSCFTTNLNSMPMWAYYGDNHTGICIEYKVKDLNKATNFNVLPVLYKEEMVKLIEVKGKDGVVNRIKFAKMLYIKNKQWSHEDEWRVVVNKDVDGDFIVVDVKKIEAIYLGCRMRTELKDKYIKLCKEKHIKCYQMFLNSDSYNLEYKLIYPENNK